MQESLEITDDDQSEHGDQYEQELETEKLPKSRTTRASSQAKNTSTKQTLNKTRAGSVSKEKEKNEQSEQKSIARRTRAASVSSDKLDDNKQPATRRTRATSIHKDVLEESKVSTRRATRASSMSKDIGVIDSSLRKASQRGQSVPKDIPAPLGKTPLDICMCVYCVCVRITVQLVPTVQLV